MRLQLIAGVCTYPIFLRVSLDMAADLSDGVPANLSGVTDTLQNGPHVGCLITATSYRGQQGR